MSQSSPQGLRLGGLELTGKVIDSSTLAKFPMRESGWERVKGILAGGPYTLDLAENEVANVICEEGYPNGGCGFRESTCCTR